MLECVDLFCGAGGLSLGLQQAGIRLRLAVDADDRCETTYGHNFPKVPFIREKIQKLKANDILSAVRDRDQLVLAGGPPCQLFSRLNRRGANITDEIVSYTNLIKKVRPRFVVLENVPQIQKRMEAWNLVISTLRSMKYEVTHQIVNSAWFGVPQSRERLILIAGPKSVALECSKPSELRTVRQAIGHYPDVDNQLPNHVSLRLSEENLARIKKLKPGENSKEYHMAFRDSYSRMYWDRPAATITTKCISFSNGRFGHPKYHRPITIREAATLQGFPESFCFHGSLWDCARQVGNAVPPPVAKAIGEILLKSATRLRRTGTRRNSP